MTNKKMLNQLADMFDAGYGVDKMVLVVMEENGVDPAFAVPQIADILRGFATLRPHTQAKILAAGTLANQEAE